MTEENEKLLEV